MDQRYEYLALMIILPRKLTRLQHAQKLEKRYNIRFQLKTSLLIHSSLQITNKILEYVYDAAMEETYMQYLVKSFKKTVADGHFDFIIVDCVNSSLKHYTDMYNFAKTYAFTVCH